jgi:flavin-dependent dehydrogenase
VDLSAMPQTSRLLATGKLTRRRIRQGGRRVLAVGDACGYVEPFTGEGIAWAIASAKEAADLLPVDGCWRDDLIQQWSQRRRRMIESHQRWCGRLRPMMHRPSLAAAALVLGHLAPPIGAMLSRRICRGGD